MQYGATNDAGSSSTQLNSTALSALVVNNTALGGGNGIVGMGVLNAVSGVVNSPIYSSTAVYAEVNGSLGYAVEASGGHAQLKITPSFGIGPSNAALHQVGEIGYDSTTSALWVCVAQGTPGTWRKLAAASTAGAFHPISPSRVHDTRTMATPIATGQTRTISVANKIDGNGNVALADIVPSGATAVAFTLTATKTVGGSGYLTINEGGNTVVSASTINWFGDNQNHANSSIVKLDAQRQVTVICGGAGSSTDFIIDITGYYL